MEDSRVEEIFLFYKDFIPEDKIVPFKKKLRGLSDNKYDEIITTKVHNPIAILLFSIFLGVFGVDRFIMGDIGIGIAKLLFGWLTLGIFPLIDIIFSYNSAKDKNYNNLLAAMI